MLGAGAFAQHMFGDAWFQNTAPRPVKVKVTVATAATRTTFARTKATARVRVRTAGRLRRRSVHSGKAG